MISRHVDSDDAAPIVRRGRGRPRRDWTLEKEITHRDSVLVTRSKDKDKDATCDSYEINTSNIQLLLHFSTSTAGTLSGSDSLTDRITSFWAYNVPQIGISQHFVLHLIFSVTAYHLAHVAEVTGAQRCRYMQQADYYFRIGLSTFTKALANADETNCGALYISATLACYCSFAIGPKGPGDLLICRVDDETAHHWLPMIKGLRLIRDMFDPTTLFSGLMSPLGLTGSMSTPDTRPECVREGFPCVEWEVPIHDLGELIESSQSRYRDVCLEEYHHLVAIYEATYGDANGEYHGSGHNRMVFGWLYRMRDEFVSCIRLKQPMALLLLSYYAVLLGTIKNSWYIDGWVEHLLDSICGMLDNNCRKWIHWPRTQVGLPPWEPHISS